MRNHYEALEVPPDASSDDIRHAFRQAIARYHPDKVQHLGKEFQQLAADRAAELTEAYRTLMDADKRADYDRLLSLERERQEAAAVAVTIADDAHEPEPLPAPPVPAVERLSDPAPTVVAFDAERANRDALIGRAAVARLKNAFIAEFGRFEQPEMAGFEVACAVKPKLFSRSTAPLFVGRFVSKPDTAAVGHAFTSAARVGSRAPHGVCVFLLCGQIPSRSELAETLAEHRRRRSPVAVFIIPIDVRDWQALLPPDAPAVAQSLVRRLQSA